MIFDTTHLDFKRTYNRVFETKMFLFHPLLHLQIWTAVDVRGKLCERNGCLEGGNEILVRAWFPWSREGSPALDLYCPAFCS